MAELYYIYCAERSHQTAYWWRPGRCGYTANLDEAGLYSKADADQILRDSGGEDFGISQSELATMKVRRVVVPDDGTNWQHFKRTPPRAPQREREGV